MNIHTTSSVLYQYRGVGGVHVPAGGVLRAQGGRTGRPVGPAHKADHTAVTLAWANTAYKLGTIS